MVPLHTQVYFEYPQLDFLYTEFEKNFDALPLKHFMGKFLWELPIACSIFYFFVCFVGPKIMKNREAFDLKYPLALWNLLLSLFSFYGVLRMVPHTIYRISTVSFEETICENIYSAFGGGAVGLASTLFCLSKVPELLDTVFIVLRKKPLIFLHWYHHITVMLYCWLTFNTLASNGLYFVTMNYTVHAIMYFYFFLQALKAVPKWFPAWTITLLQIGQMFAGTFLVGVTWYYKINGGAHFAPNECNTNYTALVSGSLIYSTYLILFVQFAFSRFLGGGESKKKRSAKKEE